MDLKLLNNPNIKWPYIALEYIESTGTQYIDTLVNPKKSIGIYVDFQFTANTASRYLFGHTYSSGTSGISYAFYINGNGIWASAYKNGTGDWTPTGITADTNRHTLEFNVSNDKAIKIDGGETYSATLTNTPSNTGNASLILFGSRNRTSGNITSLSEIKIYEVKIYDNGVLIKDMIPVINVADNSGGLLDNIGKEFYPNQGTNYFTGPIKSIDICNYITSLYTKDCPNIQSINILRNSINVSRVRINIDNQSGTITELYRYASLSGFNDAYEPQIKPRLVGTIDTPSYYSNEELSYLQSAIDGLTINVDSSKNVDDLLETDGLKVQTLDSTKPNYNPAVAIVMHNAGYGVNLHYPIVEGEGTWCNPKDVNTFLGAQFRGITTVVDTEGIVSDDITAEYDFENFEEFQYFANTSISAGSSTSELGAFGNCTNLKKIILPNTVTTIGMYAFYNCTSLKDIIIPDSVTSIGNFCFYNCTSIDNLYIPCNIPWFAFRDSSASNVRTIGAGTGDLIIKGTLTRTSSNYSAQVNFRFKNVIIYGNFAQSGSSAGTGFSGSAVTRIKGSFRIYGQTTGQTALTGTKPFFEVMGAFTNSGSASRLTSGSIAISHFGQNSLPSPTPTNFSIGNLTMIYVGDGSSRQNDEDVLALYLANSSWATYSAKLGTWYDYNGTYKWYYITDNLTNCTNTNPDEWPHITRGESYQTTIVPDEEMTLDSVTVEMYEAVDDGTTPATPTDITSSVYDSSTGEINIPAVTGNVIITASAN